ncbi:MAG: helix-turn-helix domain-containing protein [Ruminiclostridium sp.]|nr:helix-turn-helix domain-containing protein [Ruminiclostridium sp.]
MNPSELGRRIKEARLAKKLTQSDVAGTFITRNMLSQIESGAANPSLKTLEYLTSVLDIPIQVLMPDGKGEDNCDNFENCNNSLLQKLFECKRLYSGGEYSKAVRTAEELADSELSDEGYAITARSYMTMAEQAEKEGDLSAAADYANRAYEMADKGIYASRDIRTVSALLMNRIAENLGK